MPRSSACVMPQVFGPSFEALDGRANIDDRRPNTFLFYISPALAATT